MSLQIKELLEREKIEAHNEKKRLNLLKDCEVQYVDCDNEHQQDNKKQQLQSHHLEIEEKENFLNLEPVSSCTLPSSPRKYQNIPLVERLDLSSNEGKVKDKQAFIDKLINSENPLTFRSDVNANNTMLRYGEYSPNNPQFRVAAAPYIGLGEYEQRRHIFLKRQKEEYLEHIAKKNEQVKNTAKSVFFNVRPVTTGLSKYVQTDIQNIHNKLVQYELRSQNPAEKELNPLPASGLSNEIIMHSNRSPLSSHRMDQRLTTAQNALLKPDMDKPKSILSSRRTGSPRERLMADLKHTYVPSFMDGFSYENRADELEREKLKRETYQAELRHQIEEKRRLSAMREEQERIEQELGNRRLEHQLLRMQEEQMIEEQRRGRRDEQMRRNSEDFIKRKQELQARSGFRKHTDSESSVTSIRNTNVASKQFSHYSPPVSRRNPYSFNIPSSSVFADPTSRYNPNRFDTFNRRDTLNRMDSISTFDTQTKYNNAAFSRYDSLSRIDSLNRQDPLTRIESLNINDNLNRVQRRHSATQQDLSMIRRSPKLQRRSSSSKFDDSLPIPVLKAHSPVAKELKNSVAINSSRHSSDAVRKLEDKWQIPAVQRNILNHGDSREGQSRSILTQLGAIRMQLQQEQLRMDETLRKRGITQSKAVDFH